MTKFNLLLALMMLCAPLFGMTSPQEPINFMEENAGSATNPYQIQTLGNLHWLSETREVWGSEEQKIYFVQTADIDAGETEHWNDGEGFRPIGIFLYDLIDNVPHTIEEVNFFGNFDGNHFAIKNLYIGSSAIRNQEKALGLFARVQDSHLKNIRLENIQINARQALTGALVGFLHNSVISGCSSSGWIVVDDKSTAVGGLVGQGRSNKIEYCFSTITIGGHDLRLMIEANDDWGNYGHIGGIAGQLSLSSITNSYFRGTIRRQATTSGGIIGALHQSEIDFCYVATNGTLPDRVWNWYMGEMGTREMRFGAIAGMILSESSVRNSYFDRDATGTRNGYDLSEVKKIRISGVKTSQMKRVNTYKGWDFQNIWTINPDINDGYPYTRKTSNSN